MNELRFKYIYKHHYISMIKFQGQLNTFIDYPTLIDKIAFAIKEEGQTFEKIKLDLAPGKSDREHVMILPSALKSNYFGIKQLSIFEGNKSLGLPSIQGTYTLFSKDDGRVLLQIDAQELTAMRTAATSALASRFLSRKNSTKLLICGAGYLAPFMAEAHSSVRPIDTIYWWSRGNKVIDVSRIEIENVQVKAVDNLDDVVSEVDIISCVTSAKSSYLKGALLVPGQHLDLVGSYQKDRREVDDTCVLRSSLFVDQMDNVIQHAGDIYGPISKGLITTEDIKASLKSLIDDQHQGRINLEEITLFKSVGLGIEDLAIAVLVYEKRQQIH